MREKVVTYPGSSHSTTMALVTQAKEAFEDAYRAFEQLQTLIQDDQTGMWTALHVADDCATTVNSAVSAAFQSSEHGPGIDALSQLAMEVTDAANSARASLNLAVSNAENGKTSTQQAVAKCEEIITYLAATGQ